jgi:hypothetical protein
MRNMNNVEIIEEMVVVIAELQRDIDSMKMNPTYAGLLKEMACIEACSKAICTNLTSSFYAKSKYPLGILTDRLIRFMEIIITDSRNEELYLLFTHVSQLNTKFKLLR